MKSRVLLLFMLLCTCASSFADVVVEIFNGWSSYKENGKWGVLYNGKTCLLPRFDEIVGDIKNGRFVYKEGNLFGISTVWKKVTEPFCDSLVLMDTYQRRPKDRIFFAKYKKDGKWGICSINGSIILAPKYQKIEDFHYEIKDIFQVDPYKRKYSIADKNFYFMVNDGTSNKIIDILGNIIISDIDNPYSFLEKRNNNYKKIKSKALKELLKLDKSKISQIIEMQQSVISANIETTLFGEYQSWEIDIYDEAKRYNYMKTPRQLYFGKTKAFGDTTIVDGFESIVNDYGFISTPLMYNSPYFILKNDPTNIQSLLYILEMEKIRKGHYTRMEKTDEFYIYYEDEVRDGTIGEDIVRMKKRLAAYQELIKLSKEINDSTSLSIVQKKYVHLKSDIKDLKIAYEKECKRINFNNRMDRFVNIATSTLNSVANAIGGNSSNTMPYNATSNSNSKNNVSSSTKAYQMSISDQLNYNSIRNTYNKWAQDLMQMKNAIGKYQNGFKTSDKIHAQNEMKRIRKSARQKWNKEIPYNSIEDW